MGIIVHMMASGAKSKFSQEEFREIIREADALFSKLSDENRCLPKALKKTYRDKYLPCHCRL